jgi:hypothetical protein
MEQRWNDTDRGKPKDSEINLSQCHFVHHKLHMQNMIYDVNNRIAHEGTAKKIKERI